MSGILFRMTDLIIEIAAFLLIAGTFYGSFTQKHQSLASVLEKTERDLEGLREEMAALNDKYVTQIQFNQVLIQMREEREIIRRDILEVRGYVMEILTKLK
jgi:uncharacterized protein YhaN